MTKQLIKFVIVGGLAASVHLGCLWLLVEQLSLPPIGANVLAFITAFTVSYTGQSLWTFDHKKHGHGSAILRFLAVQLLCSFALNQGLYTLLLTYTALNYMLASFIVLITVPLATFTLSKYWAFK
ncbi:MAG: GtrA family protein [Endozoicomonas sp.]